MASRLAGGSGFVCPTPGCKQDPIEEHKCNPQPQAAHASTVLGGSGGPSPQPAGTTVDGCSSGNKANSKKVRWHCPDCGTDNVFDSESRVKPQCASTLQDGTSCTGLPPPKVKKQPKNSLSPSLPDIMSPVPTAATLSAAWDSFVTLPSENRQKLFYLGAVLNGLVERCVTLKVEKPEKVDMIINSLAQEVYNNLLTNGLVLCLKDAADSLESVGDHILPFQRATVNDELVVRIRVPPLPLGVIARLLAGEKKEPAKGKVASQLLPKKVEQTWHVELQKQPISALLRHHEGDPVWVSDADLRREFTAGDTIPYPVEIGRRENKHPQKMMLQQAALTDLLRPQHSATYLDRGFLNCNLSADLRVCVRDDGICLGMDVPDLEMDSMVLTLNNWFSNMDNLFPKLAPKSIEIRVYALKGTVPEDWDQQAAIVRRVVPSDEALDTLVRTMPALDAKSWICKVDDSWTLYRAQRPGEVVGKAGSGEPWTLLSESELTVYHQLLENPPRRRVSFAILIRHPKGTPLIFSRVAADHSEQNHALCFPVWKDSVRKPRGMSPIAVWLRIRNDASHPTSLAATLAGGSGYCRILMNHDLPNATGDAAKLSLGDITSALNDLSNNEFADSPLSLELPIDQTINPVSSDTRDKVRQLPRNAIRVWLLVYRCSKSLGVFRDMVFIDRQVGDKLAPIPSPQRVILLIPSSMLQHEQLWKDLIAWNSTLPEDLLLLDVLLIPSTAERSALSARLQTDSSSQDHGGKQANAASAGAALLTGPKLTRVSISFGMVECQKLFRSWLAKPTDFATAPWDFVHHHFIAETRARRVLFNTVMTALHLGASDAQLRHHVGCQDVSLIKYSAGSGATATLRWVAYQVHQSQPSPSGTLVLWVEAMTQTQLDQLGAAVKAHLSRKTITNKSGVIDGGSNKDGSTTPLSEPQVPNPYRRVLLVCDDAITKSLDVTDIKEHLDVFAKSEGLCICLLATELVGSHVRSAHNQMELAARGQVASPILEVKDVENFCRSLSNGLPTNDRDARNALELAAKHAQTCADTEASYDRHVFILCLAATRGQFQPAREWVHSLTKRIFASPPSAQPGKVVLQQKEQTQLSQLAIVLCFVSALSYEPEHWFRPVQMDFDIAVQVDAQSKAFQELCCYNTPLPNMTHSFRCIHPFVARLFFDTEYWPKDQRISWTNTIAAQHERLSKWWKDVALFSRQLLGHDGAQTVVRTILIDRPKGSGSWIPFSRLVHLSLDAPTDLVRQPQPVAPQPMTLSYASVAKGLLDAANVPVTEAQPNAADPQWSIKAQRIVKLVKDAELDASSDEGTTTNVHSRLHLSRAYLYLAHRAFDAAREEAKQMIGPWDLLKAGCRCTIEAYRDVRKRSPSDSSSSSDSDSDSKPNIVFFQHVATTLCKAGRWLRLYPTLPQGVDLTWVEQVPGELNTGLAKPAVSNPSKQKGTGVQAALILGGTAHRCFEKLYRISTAKQEEEARRKREGLEPLGDYVKPAQVVRSAIQHLGPVLFDDKDVKDYWRHLHPGPDEFQWPSKPLWPQDPADFASAAAGCWWLPGQPKVPEASRL